MYISLNWLNDFVDLENINVKDLINQFTLSVAEVEGYKVLGSQVNGVVTGRIVEINNHPNSTKLHLLKVFVGNSTLDIVCGAPNVKKDMIVPVALIGANVNGVKIEEATIAGYKSYGMCCSAKELGFSDDNSGLYEFEPDTLIGVDIKEILPIDDVVFEVDNKSLTNRPDLWGHYGIAREISALLGRKLKKLPVYDEISNLDEVKVEVESKNCYRYSSAIIKNINRHISPTFMAIRLYYTGQRAINFLADITNYIMLELGQPMHAFDNALASEIKVIDVDRDTNFKTLDGVDRILPKDTMVILANGKVSAIAGVMGGLDSEIKQDTNKVLIESACFNGESVRKTALKLGLRTESSARYEKMLDPELTMVALKRFIYLVKKYDNNAEISSGITDIYNYKYPPIIVNIDLPFIEKYTGLNIGEKRVKDILNSLGFGVKQSGDNFEVNVPTFRATKDISCKADIVEEITRIYGYDNIQAQPCVQQIKPVKQEKIAIKDYDLKLALATRFDLTEVHTYLWTDSEFTKYYNIVDDSKIKIINALQKDNNQIRFSIVPSLLKVVKENKNEFDDFGVFEIARTVEGLKSDGNADERKKLCVVLYSKERNYEDLLIEIKNICDYLFEFELKLNKRYEKTIPTTNYVSNANNYEVICNNEKVGDVGIIHPSVSMKFDKKCEIVYLELDLTKIYTFDELTYKFEAVSRFPKTQLDFNFVIDKNMLYSSIKKIAKNIKTNLEYNVSLLDIFENENNKSYTIRYEIWLNDRTLTNADIETFHKCVIETFENNDIELKMN